MVVKAALHGDVYTIPVESGLGYFVSLFHVPRWGAWIKVLEGVHKEVYASALFQDIPTLFFTFFPLKYAVKDGLVKKVGSIQLFPADLELPPMLVPFGTLPDGTVTSWVIKDRGVERRIERLAPHEERFQHEMVVNGTALSEMIADNWRPEGSIQVRKSRDYWLSRK